MKENISSSSLIDMRKLAAQGDIDVQYHLGLMYNYGEGIPRNDAEAFKWFLEAAEQGHAEAQFHLARMYYNGEGVIRDDALALTWYRKSARQGHEEALFDLGYIQFFDHGKIDFEEADDWFALISSEKDEDYSDPEVPVQERHPADPPSGRLIVKRGGHSITRQIPKPVVLIDTREKYPFDFSRFKTGSPMQKARH